MPWKNSNSSDETATVGAPACKPRYILRSPARATKSSFELHSATEESSADRDALMREDVAHLAWAAAPSTFRISQSACPRTARTAAKAPRMPVEASGHLSAGRQFDVGSDRVKTLPFQSAVSSVRLTMRQGNADLRAPFLARCIWRRGSSE